MKWWMVPLALGIELIRGSTATALENGMPTHSSAIAVSSDGAAVWVVNPDSGTAAKISSDALIRAGEYAVGHNPRTLALDQSHVFVAVQDDDLVVRLDQTDGANSISRALAPGCAPFGVATSPDGAHVYVTCERTDSLIVFDANLNRVATVPVLGTPRGIAVSADNHHVYLSHFLTREPGTTGHVSEIDASTNIVSRVFDIPIDTSTCETQNSGQGVANLMSVIALTPPGSPASVANQVWVAGARQNVATKGLFLRSSFFAGRPELARFSFPFTSFPGNDDSSRRRNIFKASFHDLIRAFIAKIDLNTGQMTAFVDVKGGNVESGIDFLPDGSAVCTVDQTANRFQLFNTARTGTVNDDPPIHQPGTCTASAFDNQSEYPFIIPPEIEQRANEITLLESGGNALTGLDYDVDTNSMKPIQDGIGTGPMGIAVSPDGQRIYSANYLSRNVTVIDAAPDSFRCAADPTKACSSPIDCADGPKFCGDLQRHSCTTSADCAPGIVCTTTDKCLPQIVAVVPSTAQDPVAPEILDGQISFSVAARDSSIPNQDNQPAPIPPSNFQDPNNPSTPGAVISTGHDGEYLACTSCHADGGIDGRSWDFSQFGASLRNTLDLRGRSSLAPGTCSSSAADSGMEGMSCTTDSACGTGSPLSTCRANPAFVPDNNPAVAAHRNRFFNPMGTIHWNGDRDEVEDFEHTFRSLQGAGDCDGSEDISVCIGALILRSFTTDPADVDADLGTPNRAIPGTSGITGIRLTHMADFVYSLSKYPRNPNLTPSGAPIDFAAVRGRAIFNDPTVGCAKCHAGPSDDNQQFSDKGQKSSTFNPNAPASATNDPFLRHNVGTANLFDLTDPFMIASTTALGGVFQNGALPIPASRGALTDYVTPVLVDAWNTAPYLHDGSAASLLDVVTPCLTKYQDCNVPGAGRNVDDHHGRTSLLASDQLNDLIAFLNAPHGTVGNGDTRATLTLTSMIETAPDLGFTFVVPVADNQMGMTINSRTGVVTLNGADFKPAVFPTLGGNVTFTMGAQVYAGTIDRRGNISLPKVNVTETLGSNPIPYVFNLTTQQAELDAQHTITGVPLNRTDGSITLVDVALSPPNTPLIGTSTPTTIQINGVINLIPMVLERPGEISGVVQDTSGRAVAHTVVLVTGGRRAITDSNGRFSISQLTLGGHTLRTSKKGVGRVRMDVLLTAAAPTQNLTLTVTQP
ncbi:MAG TPA: carboxypeptidase regulatory-like domain-containing protein [Candidatus Binatia bacterium]|nr:carboxypeptidase regulatory-like domain-containing protein [Candidatus Binatia bacterium]